MLSNANDNVKQCKIYANAKRYHSYSKNSMINFEMTDRRRRRRTRRRTRRTKRPKVVPRAAADSVRQLKICQSNPPETSRVV